MKGAAREGVERIQLGIDRDSGEGGSPEAPKYDTTPTPWSTHTPFHCDYPSPNWGQNNPPKGSARQGRSSRRRTQFPGINPVRGCTAASTPPVDAWSRCFLAKLCGRDGVKLSSFINDRDAAPGWAHERWADPEEGVVPARRPACFGQTSGRECRLRHGKSAHHRPFDAPLFAPRRGGRQPAPSLAQGCLLHGRPRPAPRRDQDRPPSTFSSRLDSTLVGKPASRLKPSRQRCQREPHPGDGLMGGRRRSTEDA